jgi:PII-like signaling protein
VTPTLQGPATRMTIYVGVDDRWQHKTLYHEIVHRAHAHGLAGASVLHGIEGYGAASFVHTDRLLDSADGLPAVVIIVDSDDKIRRFLPELDDLIVEGLVTLDPVEVVRHLSGASPS